MKPSICILALVCLSLAGCATVPPKDFTEFRRHQPRSILVLPPLNNTNEVVAGYSVLTTTTRPLSELGYYVFPVEIVDQFLKENGLPGAAEMHQAPLDKLYQVFGADAVLYITVEKYGSKYMVIANNTYVNASARLVDCRTGTLLWENHVAMQGGGNSGLIDAVVGQVMSKLMDQAHVVAVQASRILFCAPGQGLPKGPRNPEFGK
jgi:hypothetical protein